MSRIEPRGARGPVPDIRNEEFGLAEALEVAKVVAPVLGGVGAAVVGQKMTEAREIRKEEREQARKVAE